MCPNATPFQAVVLPLAVVWLSCFQPSTSADDSPTYSRDIQPLLAKHCVLCHGPDKAEAELRLDDETRAVAKLESGEHAIVAGKPHLSELIKRVTTTDESLRMPPEGEQLSAKEVALLTKWIENGARFEQHWAYRPIENPKLPTVNRNDLMRNPIDQFVLARLEHAGILPSREAAPATLIKRLSYDLIGLPPTPQQVDAFVAAASEDAYEALVDGLLASEHFGERWGRHWLDKARYADSDGYEKDRPRPNAWRYRDWVIDAINADLPFDRFTIEQLAGDQLPDSSSLQKLATAFHRQTLTNTEGGTDQEQFRVEATFDRTETTAAVWMGLTMTCARCHTHKYDQIAQREYYQLFAFFDDANEANTDVARSEAAMQQYVKEKAKHDADVAQLTRQYVEARAKLQPQIDDWMAEISARLAAAEGQKVEFERPVLLAAESGSGAELVQQKDGCLLATGAIPDKDAYTLIFELPELSLTGLRLEVLTDSSLAANGPGRAPNGNFVLSEVRANISADREFSESQPIELLSAEADHAQAKFSPEGSLSKAAKSGWAISPQMGKPHHWIGFTKQPIPRGNHRFLQVVLDQQYGGSHTIGRFRVSTMSGFDPLRALPQQVAAAIRIEAEKRSPEQQEIIADHVASLHSETATLGRQLATLKKNAPQSPTISVRVIVPATRNTKVLHRGDFLQPAEEVETDALAVISRSHPLPSRHPEKPADRLDLARWLVDSNHPLTPRVSVNHVWAHLFGRGIVSTQNDFGVRGEPPTHPQLLDWLAWQFPRDMGWSRKQLIRTIVMSATYRQASAHRPELQEQDPTNLLLARQNRVRVSAEVIRDLYLAVSGLLSDKVGGPSVFPPLPPGVAELSYANNFKWATSKGEDATRRGMYTFFKRTSPHPTLISFDCPDSNTTLLQRETSNTPLQALATLNNDVFAEASQALAFRVLSEGGTDDRQRLTYGLRLCIARLPTDSEIERFEDLLTSARDYYRIHSDDAQKLTGRHRTTEITVEENAAWVATLRMVLNLDEFIVRD